MRSGVVALALLLGAAGAGAEKDVYWPYNTNAAQIERDMAGQQHTEVPGTGYVDCDAKDVCTGADVNYRIQAVVKGYKIPGSKNIKFAEGDLKGKPIASEDVTLHTRAFEAIPGPNGPFMESCGGDGTEGVLGPCLLLKPGQKVNILARNGMQGGMSLIGPSAASSQNYFQGKANSKPWVSGRESVIDTDASPVFGGVKEAHLMQALPNQDVPSWDTNFSWDVFNIHLHGFEVQSHLFHPMGTSQPESDWITISPNKSTGRQCYCYKFTVADTMSKGTFLYHTHRHGTSSLLTWSGMFGVAFTENPSVQQAGLPQETPVTPANNKSTALLPGLVQLAKKFGMPFSDQNVIVMVIWSSWWRAQGSQYAFGNPANTNPPHPPSPTSKDNENLVVNNWVANDLQNGVITPWLVNNAFQPSFGTEAGALTLFRLVCVSTAWLCGFQILDSEGQVVPFYGVAADGITFESPKYHSNTEALGCKPENPAATGCEAYFMLGGGQRQDVVTQFCFPGLYTINQVTTFGLGSQVLATVNVAKPAGREAECAGPGALSSFRFSAARPSIMQRPVKHNLNLSMQQQMNLSRLPTPQWGISAANLSGFRPYKVRQVDMRLTGGACALWTITSPSSFFHPFHIHVNPVQVVQVFTNQPKNPLAIDAQPMYNNKFLAGEWRDTVMVPPFGGVQVKQCFDAGAPLAPGGPKQTFGGKFVFHCHFLTHEDQGLIHNVYLEPAPAPAPRGAAKPLAGLHDASLPRLALLASRRGPELALAAAAGALSAAGLLAALRRGPAARPRGPGYAPAPRAAEVPA